MDDYIDGLGLARFNSYLGHRKAYTRASTLYSLLNPAWSRYAGGSKDTSEEIRRVCEELIERLALPDRRPAAAAPVSTASTSAK